MSSKWKGARQQVRNSLRYQRKRSSGAIRNRIRLYRNPDIGYVIYPLSGSLPERSEPPRSFVERRLPLPPPAQSLQGINYTFRALGEAKNVRGVVILLKNINGGLAKLQNLRAAIRRLQAAGKRVIVYTPTLSLSHYYVAAAADRIVVPPPTEFSVLGLQADKIYLKEALASVGVSAEVVRISPYKSAGNTMAESTMTPEERKQTEWLLDEQFDMITADIAADRKLEQSAFKELINIAPFNAQAALEHNLVDAVQYDDVLAYLLADWDGDKPNKTDERAKVKLTHIGRAWRSINLVTRKRYTKFIGVVQIKGAITMESVSSPIPFSGAPDTASQSHLVPLLRYAAKKDDMAALIIYVNSPGGSALASDLIWREIDMIQRKKPVVVYMGDVAASGGYYVSASSSHIMSQRATITGSIGVIMTRLATRGLYQKLNVQQVSLKRGDNAGLYRSNEPLNDEARDVLWHRLVETYDQFKMVVANGRELAIDTLDPICEGRVWTGRQALTHSLVDSHGDFNDAIEQARNLAELPNDPTVNIPVVNYTGRSSRYVIPETVEPTAGDINQLVDSLLTLFGDTTMRELSGKPLYMMPSQIKFH